MYGMSTGAAQAAAFYEEARAGGAVWTVRDDAGIPAPMNGEGVRAMPFWSKRSRAERVIVNVPDYAGFEPVQVPLSEFLERWAPGLAKDGLLVGLNWSGPRALGYDVTPDEVAARLMATG